VLHACVAESCLQACLMRALPESRLLMLMEGRVLEALAAACFDGAGLLSNKFMYRGAKDRARDAFRG